MPAKVKSTKSKTSKTVAAAATAKIENRATFILKDIDIGYANAIRRIIIAELPTVAPSFDSYHAELNDFNFLVNTTQLHNEFMGHRIALVPMHFTMDEITNYEQAAYSFEINVKNTTQEFLDVTSKDIVIYDANGKEMDAAFRDQVFPADPITHDHVLITSLKPNLYNIEEGGHIHAKFSARKGIAKTNARWSRVSQCSYYNAVDESKSETARKEANATQQAWNTLNRDKHFKTNKYNEANELVFTIETINQQHHAMDYWTEAIDILAAQVKELSKNRLMRIHTEKVSDVLQMMIKDIDLTLANLLQVVAYNTYIRKDKKERLTFVGYYQPHPLENEIMFKLTLVEGVDHDDLVNDWFDMTLSVLNDLKTAPR